MEIEACGVSEDSTRVCCITMVGAITDQRATSAARESVASSIGTMLSELRQVPAPWCVLLVMSIISEGEFDAQTHDVVECGWWLVGMRVSRPLPAITTMSSQSPAWASSERNFSSSLSNYTLIKPLTQRRTLSSSPQEAAHIRLRQHRVL